MVKKDGHNTNRNSDLAKAAKSAATRKAGKMRTASGKTRAPWLKQYHREYSKRYVELSDVAARRKKLAEKRMKKSSGSKKSKRGRPRSTSAQRVVKRAQRRGKSFVKGAEKAGRKTKRFFSRLFK